MNQVLLTFLFSLIIFAWASKDDDEDWKEWKEENKKNYEGDQRKEMEDYHNFKTNQLQIQNHNANPEREYDQGLNKFSATDAFTAIKTYCGTRPEKEENAVQGRARGKPVPPFSVPPGPLGSYTATNFPAQCDNTPYSLAVRNQGNCGSCWAHAAVEVLETHLKTIDNAFNTQLSVAYLVDCDTSSNGCQGGWSSSALSFYQNSYGGSGPSENSYPYPNYSSSVSSTCKNITNDLVPLKISKIVCGGPRTDQEIKALVANFGAVTIYYEVVNSFFGYSAGLYNERCGGTCSDINHAMTIVGYDSLGWLVKNSWGADWGMKGFVRIKYDTCHINCFVCFVI